MNLDINIVYHHYIKKVVLFSLFLFKRQIREPNLYKLSVISYLKKRLNWEINIDIDTGDRLSKNEERSIIIDKLLYNSESDYQTKVTVSFKTPLKEVVILVDLQEYEKYEKYIYS